VGDRLEEVTGQQGLGLGAPETGPRGGTALRSRTDPGVVQDLPDGGSGDLYPENQQLAVRPAIPTSGILADQSQHQDANRAHGARPTRVPPATPDQPGGTALCSDRAAAARPRVGGPARGSPRLCPGCSSAAARTRSPHRGRPVAAARSITMPQQSLSHERLTGRHRAQHRPYPCIGSHQHGRGFGRSRAGGPDREEQLWIDAAARGALTPVHVFTIPSATPDRARMSPWPAPWPAVRRACHATGGTMCD
jgi:hypothetical protein